MRKRRPKVPKTTREREVAATRIALGDDRTREFLRRCRAFEGDVIACRLIGEKLDRGLSLDKIFYTGEGEGYYLNARADDAGDFEISFGCVAGRGAGDGATWSVRFNVDRTIQQIEATRCWLS